MLNQLLREAIEGLFGGPCNAATHGTKAACSPHPPDRPQFALLLNPMSLQALRRCNLLRGINGRECYASHGTVVAWPRQPGICFSNGQTNRKWISSPYKKHIGNLLQNGHNQTIIASIAVTPIVRLVSSAWFRNDYARRTTFLGLRLIQGGYCISGCVENPEALIF